MFAFFFFFKDSLGLKVVRQIQPLWRTVWKFLKKQKIELIYDPTIPLLGIYPEKTIIHKDTWGLPWWHSG